MKISDKLEICKNTREIAAETFYKSLEELLKKKTKISEISLREKWLFELLKNKSIFPNGWYIPPPHGFIILFGRDEDIKRQLLKSARPKEFWPKGNIFLDKKTGVFSAYFSPIHRKTGIIGDFGLTMYFGKEPKIKRHLKKVFEINKKIFEFIKVGMKLSDVAKFGSKLSWKNNLDNIIDSVSDPIKNNIGHTIPGIHKQWRKDELKCFESGNIKAIADIISKKRIFLNQVENTVIKPGMAFTIEPRLTDKHDNNLPMVYFHTIVLIKQNGEKELLTNFEEIFKLTKMDYMLR